MGMQELDQILGSSGMDVAGIAARFRISPEQANSALQRDEEGSLGAVTDADSSAEQPNAAAVAKHLAENSRDALGGGGLGGVQGPARRRSVERRGWPRRHSRQRQSAGRYPRRTALTRSLHGAMHVFANAIGGSYGG